DAVYSQVVYAAKSTDVAHVMVNGKWLMRDRRLLTIDEATIIKEADVLARQIDAFLIAREGNLINKLLAIGGVERRESFEIQVKAQLANPEQIQTLFKDERVQIVRHTHYRQYDTYFLFFDESQGRVRYREDELINDKGEVETLRTR